MHTLHFLQQMQQLGALPPQMLPMLMHHMMSGGAPGGHHPPPPGGLPPGFNPMLMPGMVHGMHPLANLQMQLQNHALFQVRASMLAPPFLTIVTIELPTATKCTCDYHLVMQIPKTCISLQDFMLFSVCMHAYADIFRGSIQLAHVTMYTQGFDTGDVVLA